MRVDGFYYTYGDDTDMIEKKWLPDLERKYSKARWIRYDTNIDDLDLGSINTDYYANNLFSEGTVLLIRNADVKHAVVTELAKELLESPVSGNALILIGSSWNKTTRFGKLIKQSFFPREFSKPELKPFDLLDSLNAKSASKVLHLSNRLFDTNMHPLQLFSLIFGHFLLLRKVKAREGYPADVVAREIKEHQFRVKMAQVANRFWSKEDIDNALKELGRVDTLLRTWQYDERMLLQMMLIKFCL